VLPSVTYPSHTTLITGVPASQARSSSTTAFSILKARRTMAWFWYAARDILRDHAAGGHSGRAA
jgi:predicted AlkP superfamily pyrophosphatase or phosphodiesterase